MRYRGLAIGLAVASLLGTLGGCIEDADCGICDPDNLVLQSISGLNYAGRRIHVVSPECEGPGCPAPFSTSEYFVQELGPCEMSDEALESADPGEFCKLSPLVTDNGLQFVFNNLLEPTSIELVRKQPDNPQLFEVYDWKVDILEVQGPITRYNGDYASRVGRTQADQVTRLVNLACIDNLRAQGQAYDHNSYADPSQDPCNGVDPSTGLPRKRFEEGVVHSYRGERTAFGNSCSAPESGHDSCCTFCDWVLTTKIERYGQDGAGVPRSPNASSTFVNAAGDRVPYAAAMICRSGAVTDDPVDRFQACRGFVAAVDRNDEERSWEYAWCAPGTLGRDCPMEVQTFKVPQSDLLRETHPDLRPAGLENLTATCQADADCDTVHGLDGTECMGVDAQGLTCLMDAHTEDGTCSAGACRPEWFVGCSDDTLTLGAETGYCVDRRFSTSGSSACLASAPAADRTEVYGDLAGLRIGCAADLTGCNPGRMRAGAELARCDFDEDGQLSAQECCLSSLSGPEYAGEADGSFSCDPYYQSNVQRQPMYERDSSLPGPARGCLCPRSGDLERHRDALEEAGCLEVAEIGCFDDEGRLREDSAGQYAVKFVRGLGGGVVYDPAIKGLLWLPADQGGVPRAAIETCAYGHPGRLIGDRNRHEGWRAHDAFTPETFENFDRAMCSGAEYRVVFNGPGNDDNPAYVRDRVGNTLEGKTVYRFETPQFHVVPGSGSPPDNLRIGACGDFSLRFSNKYDLSPTNLDKLQIWRVKCEKVTADDGSTQRVCEPTTPNDKCDEMVPVAGGPTCVKSVEDVGVCSSPCLTIDVAQHTGGEVRVEIDPDEFRAVLQTGETYRLTVPAAQSVEEALSDPVEYQRVFWDVCGMPLVREGATPYEYDFEVDPPKCNEDEDRDGAPLGCDNAEDVYNREQEDVDRDGFGDVVDLCPLLDGDDKNSADSDDDGVGNRCDTCQRTANTYNAVSDVVPPDMRVRNNPYQLDSDGDGIGDACDNCIWQPNCAGYGNGELLGEYRLGDEVELWEMSGCQRDGDADMIGDVCEDAARQPDAAGPIGVTPDDDFDQDGITNFWDACPRIPILAERRQRCDAHEDCGDERACHDGWCNHQDTDNDSVGNVCDTCPYAANGYQVEDGGQQMDDPDGDFVGRVCDSVARCAEVYNPRRIGFHFVQQFGSCCTVALIEAEDGSGDLMRAETCTDGDLSKCAPLLAPHPDDPAIDLPVRRLANCPEAAEKAFECRPLPATVEVQPGILEPPAGCEEAIAASPEVDSALDNLLTRLHEGMFSSEEDPRDALWGRMCMLPQFDQDFDGFADVCDLCKLAFDPENLQYIDENNRLWPDAGKYCSGEYAVNRRCELMGIDGEPDVTGGESGESGAPDESSGGEGSAGGQATTG